MSCKRIYNYKRLQEYYRRTPKSVRSAFWFTVCNFFLKGISFLSAPLFTRMLSNEEYGRLSLLISYEQIITILATWEIQSGSYQKGLFKYKNCIDDFTISTLLLTNCLTTLFFVVLFPFYRRIQTATGIGTIIWIILYIYLIVRPSYDRWLVKNRIRYEYRISIIVISVYSLCSVIIPILVLKFGEATAEIKFASTLIVAIIIGMFFFVSELRCIRKASVGRNIKEFWMFNIRFQGPAMLHSISYLVLSQADRIMIGRYLSNTEVAYYSVSYGIASVVSILQASLSQSIRPWLYDGLQNQCYAKIRKVTMAILSGMGIFTLLFLIIAPEIIIFLFPANYYEAMWCIPPISAGIFFVFLYSLFVIFEEYYEKTKYVMYVSVTCAVINIILNYYGIQYFGYIACAYATWISYVLFAVGHYIFMEKIRRQEIPGEFPFNIKAFFIIGFMVCIFSLVITLLYSYTKIRYILSAVSIMILLCNKSRIVKIVSEIKKRKID